MRHMRITLRHLRAFTAVAEHLHFTKAAEAVFLSQSALSGQIRQLEQELGVQLISRNTRQVELTPIGKEFYGTARRLLVDFGSAIGNVKEYQSLSKGRLTVAALPSLCTSLVTGILGKLREKYPQIDISLLDVAEHEIVQALRSKSVEIGLGYAQDLQGIDTRLLWRDRLVLLCHRAHVLAKEGKIHWRALNGHPLVAMAQGTSIRALIENTALNHKVSLDIVLEPKLMPTAIAAAEAGLGSTILPSSGIPTVLPATLVAVELVGPVVLRDISLMTLSGAALSPAAEAFRDLVIEESPFTPHSGAKASRSSRRSRRTSRSE